MIAVRNQYFGYCLLLAVVFSLSSCKTVDTSGKDVLVEKGLVTVQLQEYPAAFRNPMKGFREFFQPGVDKIREEYPYPYGSMIKEYMQWNMLEDDPSDGVEKIIAYSNHRWKGVEEMNMKVIPRVFLVWVEPWHGGRKKNPDNPDDLTGSHWPKGIPEQTGPYKQIPGSVGAMVDPADKNTPITGGYFHPDFPARVQQLVKKLGEAWDNDPRVAYVEMGIVGEWGEHHDPDLSTYWPPHDEPEHVVNRTWAPGLEKVLGDAFKAAFKNKKVMVRYAYEFNDYEFGIYWDSWSQREEEVRGYQEMMKLKDRWKTQPIGGEITWNWGSLQKFKSFEQVVKDREYFTLTMHQIRNLHANHLGGITWANFKDTAFLRVADSLQQAMGYRFVLMKASFPTQIKNGNNAELSFQLINKGSSPFYYNWPVQVSLLDPQTRKPVWSRELKDIDIRSWMPGEDWDSTSGVYRKPAPVIEVKTDWMVDKVPTGKYILALSIVDPSGLEPSLRFANLSYYTGGYTVLGYIGVEKELEQFAVPWETYNDIQADTSLRYLNVQK
ncbi:DUF4832 domain-containing protein [Flavihumibacter sp. UBA7668]|uniref:DUF4832 domain-containing protein n=1 Tax=Flavihumibacter sp. UBA7668 TaxID=1946542 RepID=UPI0025B825EB|nr:DUF4832 domain-containing protein [Flavihumibacter sp. UBA7668]